MGDCDIDGDGDDDGDDIDGDGMTPASQVSTHRVLVTVARSTLFHTGWKKGEEDFSVKIFQDFLV